MSKLKSHQLRLEKDKFGASIPFIESQHNIKILLAYVRGSHMYGTATDKSDVDITFVYKQPTNEILKTNYIPYIDTSGTGDIVGYEIQNYLDLLGKNNPNILESLDIPEECLIYKHDSMKVFEDQTIWISKLTEKTILGYADSQIKKATGLNKNMNNPQPKERKSILDFCYIIIEGKSVPFFRWYKAYKEKFEGTIDQEFLDHNNWGLSKVENGKGVYALYLNYHKEDNMRGLVKDEESTQLRTSEIPHKTADSQTPFVLYYNLDGFEVHCKQHKAYWDWEAKRNKERFNMNQKAGQGVDLKNMSHLFRLLEMALNLSLGKGLSVRTENVSFLREIREGKHDYKQLMIDAERLFNEIKGNFESVDLPETIDLEKVKTILLNFRLS